LIVINMKRAHVRHHDKHRDEREIIMPYRNLLLASLVWLAATVAAEVPEYELTVVAEFTTATTLRAASNAGHMVGDQVVDGQSRAFLATMAEGLQLLPLPAGFNASAALDVNSQGVVVGTVSDQGLVFDLGEPAVWVPDAAGDYQALVPQQFATLPSPLGTLAVTGGQIVAINESGLLLGWSRLQGFQGGPTTLFSLTDAPLNLGELGFAATVTDINNNNVIVGGQLRMDLDTTTVLDLGVPDPLQPGNVSFSNAIAFAINDNEEAVVAANLASVPTENWLTYLHNDVAGYQRLNSQQLPALNVGFYDNNNLGDVAASGGILFAAEQVLVQDFDALLEPEFANWDTRLGFIADDRRVYTTAEDFDVLDRNALVVLTPLSDVIHASGFETL